MDRPIGVLSRAEDREDGETDGGKLIQARIRESQHSADTARETWRGRASVGAKGAFGVAKAKLSG